MRRNSCCFTGHRAIPQEDVVALKHALRSEIERLAQKGVTEFYAGGARGFDMLAEETVLEVRETAAVHLHLLLACKDQDSVWPQSLRRRFENILNAADSVRYISESYSDDCMRRRNDALVESSAYCICYMQRNFGGTAYTVKKARRDGLEIIHLLTSEPEQLTLDSYKNI